MSSSASVILTPPSSLRPDVVTGVFADEASRAYAPTQKQDLFMNRVIDGASPLVSKAALVADVSEMLKHPESADRFFLKNMLLSVQTQKVQGDGTTSYRFRKMPFDVIASCIQRGFELHIHEVIRHDASCKGFWDIDLHRYLSPVDLQLFCRQFVAELSRKLGYSSDIEDYRFMQCCYPEAKAKTSLHVTLPLVHYESPLFLLSHMQQNDVDFDRFSIDRQLYSGSSWKTLRMLGSSKWDDCPVPFVLLGTPHTEVTVEVLQECLAGHVCSLSQPVDMQLNSQEQRLLRAQGARVDDAQGPRDPRITKCVDYFRARSDDPGEFDIFAISCPNGDRIDFSLSDHGLCPHTIKCSLVHKLDFAMYHCVHGCFGGDVLAGVTETANQYLQQLEWLKFLQHHNLARIDFPLAETTGYGCDTIFTIGRYGLTKEQFFEQLWNNCQRTLRCNCAWCRSPVWSVPKTFSHFLVKQGTGKLFDLDFFNFIRDRYNIGEDSQDITLCKDFLIAYVALFVGHVLPTDSWTVRTRTGFADQSKMSVQTVFCASLSYKIMKPKGRGKNQTFVEEEVKFWKHFADQAPSYDSVKHGKFSITPGGPLNLLSPLGVDVTFCSRKWKALPMADRKCLRHIWFNYLHMAVLMEEKTIRPQLIHQLQRWIWEVAFELGVPTHVMLLLKSTGGGQGKSTLGNILCAILGHANSTITTPEDAFGSFSEDTLKQLIFMDEVHITKALSEKLKSRITAPFVQKTGKYKRAVQVENTTNYLCTSNNRDGFSFVNSTKERRTQTFQFPEMSVLDASNIFVYDCKECGGPVDSEWGAAFCPHTMHTHQDCMELLYTLILGKTKEGVQEGLYFSEFVGMLFEAGCAKKADGDWNIPLQQCLILTNATVELQQVQDTLVARFIDYCIEIGYHWSPYVPPEQLKSIWIHREVDMARLEHEEKPRWEPIVCTHALYQRFAEWCRQTNNKPNSESEFFGELEMISMSRRKTSLKPLGDETGKKLKWDVPFQNQAAKWAPISNAIPIKTINMGTLEQWKRTSNAGQSTVNASLKRIASLPASLNGSVNMSQPLQPSPFESSSESSSDDDDQLMPRRKKHQLFGQAYEEAENRRLEQQFQPLNESTNQMAVRLSSTAKSIVFAKRIRDQEDDENPRDAFAITDQLADMDIDEAVQDAEAQAADELASFKKAKTAGIDLEAEEGEEEGSGSLSIEMESD